MRTHSCLVAHPFRNSPCSDISARESLGLHDPPKPRHSAGSSAPRRQQARPRPHQWHQPAWTHHPRNVLFIFLADHSHFLRVTTISQLPLACLITPNVEDGAKFAHVSRAASVHRPAHYAHANPTPAHYAHANPTRLCLVPVPCFVPSIAILWDMLFPAAMPHQLKHQISAKWPNKPTNLGYSRRKVSQTPAF